MAEASSRTTESFSSGTGFVLATVGAAVGLGNLWRFPFVAGENGGGAFVLLYLLCIVVLGVPIITAEAMLGRHGGGSAVESMRRLIAEAGASRLWKAIGVMSLLIPFVGLSYYAIVGGWVYDYLALAATGTFAGLDAEGSGALFGEVSGTPGRALGTHLLFTASVAAVVIFGVRQGIEQATRWMMPTLFVFLVGLMLYAAVAGDLAQGAYFLLWPHFDQLSWGAVQQALGQAFFSIAVGVGVMITYGAYTGREVSLLKAGATIAFADTLVAILAGFMIFPLVFGAGLDPAGGPGLIFVTLPIAFGQMPGGQLVGTLFFVLLGFAAFTTGLGMLEPLIAWLRERLPWNRRLLVPAVAGATVLLGVLPNLSFGPLADFHPLSFVPLFAERNIFDVFDFTIAAFMLPLNGLLISLFAGWVISRDVVVKELQLEGWVLTAWRISLRFLIPLAIFFIFIAAW